MATLQSWASTLSHQVISFFLFHRVRCLCDALLCILSFSLVCFSFLWTTPHQATDLQQFIHRSPRQRQGIRRHPQMKKASLPVSLVELYNSEMWSWSKICAKSIVWKFQIAPREGCYYLAWGHWLLVCYQRNSQMQKVLLFLFLFLFFNSLNLLTHLSNIEHQKS